MTIDLEKIKQTTVCTDCGGKEMALGYGTSEGALYKSSSFLGLPAYSYATDRISVICTQCGLIVKEYAKEPAKMK